MDNRKIVLEELRQAGVTLHGEGNITAARTIWERASKLADMAGLPDQKAVFAKLMNNAREKDTETPVENAPVPDAEMLEFSDIIGAEREKAEIIREFLRYHKYPNLYVQGKAMLMYGPPGTGKTMIAKGIASAFNQTKAFANRKVHLFAASGADLKGKYYGETEKNIKSWFVSAQTLAEQHNSVSILFLDEFEALAADRQGPMASTAGSASLTALLQFIDGVAAFDKVILLAATNGPWDLDSAVLRRFTSKLFVDLPSDQTRQQLIATLIGKRLTTKFQGGWMDDFCVYVSTLMGANKMISTVPDLDAFLTAGGRLTRDGIHILGYSLSDVTHTVNSALNMLAEKLVVLPYKNSKDQTCYFEPPTECQACIECTHQNGADLLLTLDHLHKYGAASFTEAVTAYPSSINVSEYSRFIRYYKHPNQFTE